MRKDTLRRRRNRSWQWFMSINDLLGNMRRNRHWVDKERLDEVRQLWRNLYDDWWNCTQKYNQAKKRKRDVL